jgi:hypothetical protein
VRMMIFFRRVLEASIYLRYVRHHRSSSSWVCGRDFPGQRELLADNAKTFHNGIYNGKPSARL